MDRLSVLRHWSDGMPRADMIDEIETLRAGRAKDYAALVGHAKDAESLREQLRGAVEEAEKWKRIAQNRCTCVKACGDTPEDSGGICKELPRDRGL